MATVCPSCGHDNADDARFCSHCAESLNDSVAEAKAERRQITVFFSDVSGYTAMSERLDPEDVRQIMNLIFARAEKIVDKYGGRIENLLGDAVMAVFGDPVVHEDDAERAVRAALEIHAAVEELSPRVESKIGSGIAMHTGINTGLVITSSADFKNAVGDAINVAARLGDLSESGEILVGADTAEVVAGVFTLEEKGRHELKGKSGLIPVTRVVGLAPTRIEPSRRQAEFVGRHEELGVLLGAVERMRDGKSSVITIRAEAGTGKTRLLSEFRKRLPDKVQWLEGRAYEYGENIPYAPVIDLLRRAIGIGEDDPPETVQSKLRTAAADLVDDVARVYAPLTRLFGVETSAEVGLDRESYQKRLLDSVLAMAEALAGRAPTVLTFQDLHWADPSTVELIRGLIDRLETPALVVANYRPPFSLDTTDSRELELADLSPRQTGELVTSLLGGGEPPKGLVDFIVDRTQGNPFFAEEIINALIETGTLHRDENGWRIAGGLDQIDLPMSIRGVIAARIDRLDNRRRRVLREASVVGREFLYDVVARVTTLVDELDPSLKELEAADLIREKRIDPDLEYIFKHALTQDVAYDGLLKTEREQLHARAAAAIELQFEGRLEEVTETLAYHWTRSDNTEKAVEYLIAAGRKAMERYALRESQAYYEQAYEVLLDESQDVEKDRAIVELILQWAQLAYYQARLHDLGQYLIRHQDALDRVGDAEQSGMWKAWLGHTHWLAEGRFREAVETLQEAVQIGRQAKNVRVVAYAQTWRLYSLLNVGRIDDGMEAGLEAQKHSALLPDEPYVWFKSTSGIGMLHAVKGEFAEALAIADELIEFGERTGSARSKAMGGWVLGLVANTAGDESMAAHANKLALESGGDPIYQHSPSLFRLPSLITAGKIQEARAYHDEHYQSYVVERQLRGSLASALDLHEGLLLLHEGHPTTAFEKVEEMIEHAANAGERFNERYASMILALMYAGVAIAEIRIGDVLLNLRFTLSRGLRASREAHQRIHYLLGHLDEWHHGGWRFPLEKAFAQLLAHEGDTEGAKKHLQRAITAIEPAGATAGLRAARKMLKELSV